MKQTPKNFQDFQTQYTFSRISRPGIFIFKFKDIQEVHDPWISIPERPMKWVLHVCHSYYWSCIYKTELVVCMCEVNHNQSTTDKHFQLYSRLIVCRGLHICHVMSVQKKMNYWLHTVKASCYFFLFCISQLLHWQIRENWMQGALLNWYQKLKRKSAISFC